MNYNHVNNKLQMFQHIKNFPHEQLLYFNCVVILTLTYKVFDCFYTCLDFKHFVFNSSTCLTIRIRVNFE